MAADPHAAFLADIFASPADDTVRLIYADFLEEHGEPERAEFIRVQIALDAGCKVCDGSGRNVMSPCPCSVLRNRERELWDAVWPKIQFGWYRNAVGSELAGWPHFQHMRRGFFCKPIISAEAWLAHAEELTESNPVEEVALTIMPSVEPAGQISSGMNPVRPFRLYAGSAWGKSVMWPGNRNAPSAETLLSFQWPRIRFVLPKDEITAPLEEESEASMPAADWRHLDNPDPWTPLSLRAMRRARRLPRDTGTLRSSITPSPPV